MSALQLPNPAIQPAAVTDDLDALLDVLPPHLAAPLHARPDRHELLEVVMDLGRRPEARFPTTAMPLGDEEVTADDLQHVVSRLGAFGDDNRAGIERTLHRISALRNRRGDIVGLSCRVGRAVLGATRVIDDLIESDRSLMLLGRPGVGKTTMLREIARVLADDYGKRVVIVDTSNEIGGDGDVPHPGIGSARRMQVPTPRLQHAVMIEAVENHMPEIIVIDEIGTEAEAAAARTIAERGVQLVGTAHGNTLTNLMLNPTLADLIGGIQTVTLGDEEARRRGTQKSVLERKAPPTFDAIVEIHSWDRVAIYENVAETIDGLLRGQPLVPEERWLAEDGSVQRGRASPAPVPEELAITAEPGGHARAGTLSPPRSSGRPLRVYAYGVSRPRLSQAAANTGVRIATVDSLADAEVVLTLKNTYRRHPPALREAEDRAIPIQVVRSNTGAQIEAALDALQGPREAKPFRGVLRETQEAIRDVADGDAMEVELTPQKAYIRRLQHQMATRHQVGSRSTGREPLRRVKLYRLGSPGDE